MVLLCYSQTLAGVMLVMHYLDSVHITNIYVLPNFTAGLKALTA